MPRAAPRISHLLLEALERLDDGRIGYAELARRLGVEADRLGLPRPSYEQVRALARRNREIGAARPGTADVLLDVVTRARPAEAIVDHLTGTLPPK